MTRLIVALAAFCLFFPAAAFADIAAPSPPESQGMTVEPSRPAAPVPPDPGTSSSNRIAPPSERRIAPPEEQVACPMDAKLCPDGSSVGRTGPDCTFPPCPGEGNGGGAMPYPMPPQPEPMPPEPPIRPPRQSLQVDPNDAQCINDSECVMVHTTCGGCDCGTPVNQMFALKYKDRLMKMCENAPPVACGMACPVQNLVCNMGRCTTR